MMDSIAAMSMDMSAARLAVEYSMKVTANAMDTQEAAAQSLLEMLPPTTTDSAYIDTYA